MDVERNWIAVTGSGGFVGRHLVAKLLTSGHRVVFISRYKAEDLLLRDAQATGNARSVLATNLTPMDLESVHAVIMLAGVAHRTRNVVVEENYFKINVGLTEQNALTALRAGCRRLVYLSSVAVHGSGPFAEAIDENSLIAPSTPYARSKWAAEQALADLSRQFDAVLVRIRSPLVYAHDAPGSVATLRQAISRGLPLPLGSINNRRSIVAIGDLVDALIRAALQPLNRTMALLTSNPTPVSTPDIIRAIAREQGCSARLFNVPPDLIAKFLGTVGLNQLKDQLLSDYRIDPTSAIKALNWLPRASPFP